ncbi:MAG: hypothetical protein RRA92_11040, partial [Gemmatimonadota bacterium]|nr:hypothetical protein [Gemmatimonadota bacterium]
MGEGGERCVAEASRLVVGGEQPIHFRAHDRVGAARLVQERAAARRIARHGGPEHRRDLMPLFRRDHRPARTTRRTATPAP